MLGQKLVMEEGKGEEGEVVDQDYRDSDCDEPEEE
jgi:hypothetical protein